MTDTLDNLTENLIRLGIKKSDNVLIHSSVFSLNVIENFSISELPNALLQGLELAVGETGSVFVPVFNYQFPSTRQADLRSQPTVLGIFPEWFRQQKNIVRSGHPMFSVAGRGPNAEQICQPNTPEYNPFGINSTFARLIDSDALLLLQGTTLKVATIMVQIEAMLDVRYRFYKPFHGSTIIQSGQEYIGDYYHFCFPINNAYRENYVPFEQHLLEKDLLNRVKIGRGYSYAIRLQALYHAVKEWLADNKHGLLNSDPSHYYQFRNNKEEIYPIPK